MDLLYIQHPNEETHYKQVSFLESLPDSERSEHAQLFRFGNAAMHYYKEVEATEEDYVHWLEGLEGPIRRHMEEKGFAYCKNTIPLLRHVQELRDIGMSAFVKSLFNQEDFEAWEQT